MPESNRMQLFRSSLKQALLIRALPRLAELPPGERDTALAHARETRFDPKEWIGVLAGVVFVTWLLRFEQRQIATFSLPLPYFAQFAVAAPLLVLIVGPFYWRCMLRGLDEEIERRRLANPSGNRS